MSQRLADYTREMRGYVPDAYENEYPMVDRLHRRDCFHAKCVDPRWPQFAESAAAYRVLMERLGAPRSCDRPTCRRARKCRAPKLDCLFRNLPWMQQHVLPLLVGSVELKRFEEANETQTSFTERE